MRMIPLFLVTVAIFGILITPSFFRSNTSSEATRELKTRYAKKHVRSVDHAKLPALQRKFASGPEVTAACISCHTERHKEVLNSSHWNWSRQEYIPGRGIRSAGKKNVLNNYCVGVSSNLEGCDKCHAGYGFVKASYDFSDARNIDCLVCHDGSETYTKGTSGLPEKSVNLTAVAQRVGRPQRSNCGVCHFYGGGGNNVKHGDLEQAMQSTNRDVDVHMGTNGSDLECVACHTSQNHRISGKLYSVSSMNRDRVNCEQCHGEAPHSDDTLNEHTLKVACQTCHIPYYAKANATKMTWDWSTAGRLRNGEPYEVKDAAGNLTYASIKGTFTWGRNVKPEYVWFNGTAGHYMLGDKVDSQRPVQMNTLYGSYEDPSSKIIPVKIHRGSQAYDPGNGILIQPKLYARGKGEGGFWKDFDWESAAREGMRESGLPYSGRHEFVKTVMYWPVNHMVAPKDTSVQCVECHTRNNSRLAAVPGFYMPGRDRNTPLDTLGTVSVAGAFAGALLHALGRIWARNRRKAQS